MCVMARRNRLRELLTGNANPEGVNQYSKGGGSSKKPKGDSSLGSSSHEEAFDKRARSLRLKPSDFHPAVKEAAVKAMLSPMTAAVASDHLKAAGGDVKAAASHARETAERMKDSPHGWHHAKAAEFLETM